MVSCYRPRAPSSERSPARLAPPRKRTAVAAQVVLEQEGMAVDQTPMHLAPTRAEEPVLAGCQLVDELRMLLLRARARDPCHRRRQRVVGRLFRLHGDARARGRKHPARCAADLQDMCGRRDCRRLDAAGPRPRDGPSAGERGDRGRDTFARHSPRGRAYAWLFVGITFEMILLGDRVQTPELAVTTFALTRIAEVVAGTSTCVIVSALQPAHSSAPLLAGAPQATCRRVRLSSTAAHGRHRPRRIAVRALECPGCRRAALRSWR